MPTSTTEVTVARLGHPGAPSAGFTLLELLVVLSLAALAVGVVGGGAQAYLDRARYQQTVRDVASQLQQARLRSLDDGRSVLVSYQPQTRQLRIAGQPVLELPPKVELNWQPLAAAPRPVASGSEPIFLFNADGGARGGPLVVSRAGRGVRFQVNWLLGLVEQLPEHGEPAR